VRENRMHGSEGWEDIVLPDPYLTDNLGSDYKTLKQRIVTQSKIEQGRRYPLPTLSI
jgi:hypothetical protein